MLGRSFVACFERAAVGIRFGYDDYDNHRLPVCNEFPLTARQRGEEGQFRPLHRRLDSAQGIATNQNLVSGEDQTKMLLLRFGFEFGESKLVKRQQQTPFSRQFDFDAVCVRVARPTFGCFWFHAFV